MSSNCVRCNAEVSGRAAFCPQCGSPVHAPGGAVNEFRAWRIHVCKVAIVVNAILVFIGLLFLPLSPVTTLIVSGLAMFGLIYARFRLSRLRLP
jgi:hypothetical protein